MKVISFRKGWLRPILLVLLIVLAGSKADDIADDGSSGNGGPFTTLREKYDELPQAAKIGATALAGFVASRVALKTFVSAAKVAGAAFITAEVLSVSGVMDEMPEFVDDHVQTVSSAKDRILAEASKFRKGVRSTLKKEKIAAFGFAGGAFLGIAL